MIKTIIFDIGETVARGMYGIEDPIAREFRVEKEGLLAKLSGGKTQALFSGRISEDEYWERVIKENGFPDGRESVEFLKAVVRDNFAEVDGMRDLLLELRQREYRLACLSDHCREWWGYIESKFHLEQLFDRTYFSFTIGDTKKFPHIYHHILQDLKADPETVLFVDDRERNIQIARDPPVNIRYVHQFRSAAALRQELCAYLPPTKP
jgi:putative hydrolase of the HAD superfamily